MNRNQVVELLKNHLDEIQSHGVVKTSIFGSFARDEAKAGSDVDILVEFTRPVGLLEFARLKSYLEELLGREVDLVTREAIRPEMREDILQDAVHAA